MALILNLGYIAGFRQGDWVNYSDFRYINAAAMDQTTAYFATTNGVIRYDKFANRWLDPMTITDGIPDKNITNIAYDPDYDRFWVATSLGNAYYQPTSEQWYPGGDFPTNWIRNDYHPGSLGVLNTEYGYLYQNGRLNDLDFRTYQLTRGVDDGFNHLFVGTWGLGTVVINPRYGDLKRLPFGPYSEDVSALVRVGDKFWIGGGPTDPEPGLTLCDTSLQDWHWYVPRYATGLSSSNISCAVGDKKITWLGTDYGLVRYVSENESFETFADFASLPSVVVTSLAADTAWIYIGTESGLTYIGKSEGPYRKSKPKKAKGEPTDTLAQDSTAIETSPLPGKNRLLGWYIHSLKVMDGYLYVATDRGALRRPINQYSDFEILNTPEKMLSDDILDLAQVGDSLLFATRNDIIIVDIKTGVASTITHQSYFGLWHIRKITADSGNIWAATDIGLWKYRLSDGYYRLFTVNDGMISSDIRSLEIVGDYVWMATPKGVIRFFWNRPGRID
jgi:ligand-binding sensor domain-containing protein